MSLICYTPKKFSADHQAVIATANSICQEYAAEGFTLTLRQLYYQFVARDLLANQQQEYKRLGSICNDARMAGEMDWDYLIDRTRNVVSQPHWRSTSDLLLQSAEWYREDLWARQKERIFVWVEKDAAIGVIEQLCSDNDVSYFSTRGYTSVSELWAAAQSIRYEIECGNCVTILHIGDHDPSGLDMTRDIADRLHKFVVRDWLLTWGQDLPRPVSFGAVKQHMRSHMWNNGSNIDPSESPWSVQRIALNYDQVEQYSPPPNPAKGSDARYAKYVEETGLDESWELDALDPGVLRDLIQSHIDGKRNDAIWAESERSQDEGRAALVRLAGELRYNR